MTSMQLFTDSNYLSPYAMSVFVSLREKGIAFDTVPVDLEQSEHLAPVYAGISTTRRIPSINDNGFLLSESSAICEYLEDQYPHPAIYPGNVAHRAKAREVQAWVRSDLLPLRAERPTEFVFLKRSPVALSRAAQVAAAKLIDAAEQWLPLGQQTMFGRWSIADTDLALMLNRLVLAGDAVPERLAQYARLQWLRPSVQAWIHMRRSVQ
jgi:glutathione S-transferase